MLVCIYSFLCVSAGGATHSTCVQSVIGRSSVCGFSTASLRSSVTLKKPIRHWLPSTGSTCDAPLTHVVFGHLFLIRTPSSQPIRFLQPSAELRSDFRDFPGLLALWFLTNQREVLTHSTSLMSHTGRKLCVSFLKCLNFYFLLFVNA